MPKIITPTQYIKMAQAKHGVQYDYAHTVYKGMNQKTLDREAELKELGFQLVTIWESDYDYT